MVYSKMLKLYKSRRGDFMDKSNEKKRYLTILVGLFVISALIAVVGSLYKGSFGDDYVFHSWLSIIHVISWILTIGLALMIPFTYINVWAGIAVIPFILIILLFGIVLGYDKEIRTDKYIIIETQQLGEKAVRYYEDINPFIMKFSHEKYVR